MLRDAGSAQKRTRLKHATQESLLTPSLTDLRRTVNYCEQLRGSAGNPPNLGENNHHDAEFLEPAITGLTVLNLDRRHPSPSQLMNLAQLVDGLFPRQAMST